MTYRMRDPGRRYGYKGFDESQHPRDGHGKFAAGDDGGKTDNAAIMKARGVSDHEHVASSNGVSIVRNATIRGPTVARGSAERNTTKTGKILVGTAERGTMYADDKWGRQGAAHHYAELIGKPEIAGQLEQHLVSRKKG